jgi:hypothetical protein
LKDALNGGPVNSQAEKPNANLLEGIRIEWFVVDDRKPDCETHALCSMAWLACRELKQTLFHHLADFSV